MLVRVGLCWFMLVPTDRSCRVTVTLWSPHKNMCYALCPASPVRPASGDLRADMVRPIPLYPVPKGPCLGRASTTGVISLSMPSCIVSRSSINSQLHPVLSPTPSHIPKKWRIGSLASAARVHAICCCYLPQPAKPFAKYVLSCPVLLPCISNFYPNNNLQPTPHAGTRARPEGTVASTSAIDSAWPSAARKSLRWPKRLHLAPASSINTRAKRKK
ncbi:hypothetical protein F4777DRAFT_228044 [Nemania sp. FL0916]|nr:hypothetical protein F4777DRAFT_228044 [Nemania sp. FL0916]